MIWLNPQDRLKQEAEVKEKHTVKELRSMCKEQGLSGYSKLKEDELIELLGL